MMLKILCFKKWLQKQGFGAKECEKWEIGFPTKINDKWNEDFQELRIENQWKSNAVLTTGM